MTKEDATGSDDTSPLNPAISKGLYSLCYYLAFGAVYASELAMELIPADSMVRHGFEDGAEAAHRAWTRSHEEDETAESEMDLPEVPVGAAESN